MRTIMRPRFEFTFYRLTASAEHTVDVDPTLSLLGSQGWEIRGICPAGDAVIVALQRPEDAEAPLPDAPALAAALAEPLAVPTPDDLDVEAHQSRTE